ncbi:hypothetical protein VTN00DRAFT_1078 [Thermoascus crustaceus]|uniref:uncharacterized protein n=1 Tax=Thermoascus crustaceus TaxID=5088 RepID=UPI0037449276
MSTHCPQSRGGQKKRKRGVKLLRSRMAADHTRQWRYERQVIPGWSWELERSANETHGGWRYGGENGGDESHGMAGDEACERRRTKGTMQAETRILEPRALELSGEVLGAERWSCADDHSAEPWENQISTDESYCTRTDGPVGLRSRTAPTVEAKRGSSSISSPEIARVALFLCSTDPIQSQPGDAVRQRDLRLGLGVAAADGKTTSRSIASLTDMP